MIFDPNVPIYIQIMDEFKRNIVSGTFTLGSKVKSVRDLAVQYAVNPNTVQRALSELERLGLVRSERTIGRFICEDEQLVKQLRIEQATSLVENFIRDMQALGFSDPMIQDAVQKMLSMQKVNS